jgi:hypothetical protein
MDTEHSCTADVIFDIKNRVVAVIETERLRSGSSAANQMAEVQSKIDELKEKGFLKRQEYAAATNADFQRMFAEKAAVPA